MAENTPRVNPLASMMRQPRIYITLPSGGKYWEEGALNPTINGEYPVYSMTARDEIILKTPDALMNGQGVVDVIQSCMPNIRSAWSAPQIDLDAILVAIRIATYGEELTLEINHPTMESSMDYNVNLREILESIQNRTGWEDRYEINPNLIVYLKPISYRQQTLTQVGEFETERMMMIIKDENLDEATKLAAFKGAFESLAGKTLDMIVSTVYKVESSAGTTDDPEYIVEFIKNCDAEIFEAIKTRLADLANNNMLQPLKISSTAEMREKGAPEVIEVPFSFDASNFFD